MMRWPRFVPVSSLTTAWPGSWPPLPSTVGVVRQAILESGGKTTAHLSVVVPAPSLSFALPGVEEITVVVPGDDDVPLRVEVDLTGDLEIRIRDVGPSLQFASNVLVPVQNVATSGRPVWEPVEPPALQFALPSATIVVDQELRLRLKRSTSFVLPPVRIGDSGIVLEADGVTLHLSGDEAPPVGQPPGFRGIAFDAVRIYLPDVIQVDVAPDAIEASGVCIGKGGLSGRFAGSWTPAWEGSTVSGSGAGDVAGFGFGLELLEVLVTQSEFADASLRGSLLLPFFDQLVNVAVSLGRQGDVALRLSGTEEVSGLFGTETRPADVPLVEITVPGVGVIELSSLALEVADRTGTLQVRGVLQLGIGAQAIRWPRIGLDGLELASSGSVRVPGGWLDLQEPLAVDLYGFTVEVSRVGFGNTDDGRRFVSMSGGVQLGAGLPSGASVEGLRVLWDPTGVRAPEIQLEGVGIELAAPGVRIEARVAFRRETDETGEVTAAYFEGAAKVSLEALDVVIDGSVKIGRAAGADPFTFVYVFIDVAKSPIGIPIGPTGAAIYGVSGLFGANVTPDRAPGQPWYAWYTSEPGAFSMTDPAKWVAAQGSIAVGAGVTIGTLFDSGFAINTKALLVLTTPGPVLMLHGRANVLRLPPDLAGDAEGALDLLAVLDNDAGTFQMNVDASYEVPKLVDIAASGEAFFDFADPNAWHLFVGEPEPADRRVRADVIGLFHADGWFVLEPPGLETGFRVQYGGSWTFGPVGATLVAWIGAEAAVSWRPPQIEASLGLGGEIALKAGPLSMGIAVEASLTGRAPAPYFVAGDLEIAVDLPAPLKDIEIDVHLEWSSPTRPDLVDPVLEHVGVESPIETAAWQPVLADSATAIDPTADDSALPIVPLDGKVVLVFGRPMNDVAGIAASGGLAADVLGEYALRYELVDVALERMPRAIRAGGAWQPVTLDASTWVAQPDLKSSRLQIGVRTPFAYTRSTSRTLRDRILAVDPHWPCLDEAPPAEVCANWEDYAPGTSLPAVSTTDLLHVVAGGALSVQTGSAGAPVLRIALQGAGFVAFVLPAPCRTVRVVVDTNAGAATARIWSRGVELDAAPVGAGEVVFTAEAIDEVTLDGVLDLGIARVCWLTEAEALHGDALVRQEARVLAASEAWSQDEAVFEPESWYRLKVVTKAVRERDGEVDATIERTRWAFFRTAGAPEDLRPYARRTVPAEAGEAYRAYDVGVDWDTTYVEALFGGDLAIHVVDANDAPVATLANAWGRAPEATLSDTELAWTTRIEACTGASSTAVEADQVLLATGGGLLSIDSFPADLAGFDAPAETGTPASGWFVASGALFQGQPTPQTVLPTGDPTWTDVAVESQIRSTAGHVGVVARWSGPDDHLRLSVDRATGGRVLMRVAGGVATGLWLGTGGHPEGAFTLTLRCEGGRLRGQLDDELLFDLDDPDAPMAGKVGLYTADNATASFGALRVSDCPGDWLASRLGYRADVRGTWLLYRDAFADAALPGWVHSGWTAGAGELRAPDTSTAAHADEGTAAEIGRSDWTDLRVEVEVTVADRAGIALRRDGTGYVLVEIDASTGEVVVGQRVGTAFTEIGRAPIGDATTLDLAVTAEGTRIGVEIGGDEVLVVEGPAASPGPIALCSAGPGAVFSGFAVRSWPRTTVLAWPFTSSRYAGFAELAQAFTGDVFPETVAPTADLATAAAAGASFEELYALLGGVAVHRAPPPQLELSELVDEAGTRVALLLESPEPLDMERLELTWFADGSDVTSEMTVRCRRDATKAIVLRGAAFTAGSYAIDAVYRLDGATPVLRGGSATAEVGRLEFALA